jgi:hypothetical protein
MTQNSSQPIIQQDIVIAPSLRRSGHHWGSSAGVSQGCHTAATWEVDSLKAAVIICCRLPPFAIVSSKDLLPAEEAGQPGMEAGEVGQPFRRYRWVMCAVVISVLLQWKPC